MGRFIFLSVMAFCLALQAKAEICEKNYDMLGCYEETSPTTLLFNDRVNINWQDIVGYMAGLACKCGKLAKEGGYAGFALHYWGECYGKTAAQINVFTSSKQHKEQLCVGDQTYTKCDKESHAHCTGKGYAEGVFIFKSSAEANVDGGFGAWQGWTACDKQCGTGMKHRERNCDNPSPSGNGKDCGILGLYSESKACKLKDCPVDGGYGAWTAYGECSKSCGNGIQTRTRPCNNPEAAYGGKDCSSLGVASQEASCNTHGCPVNGGYSSWSAYGACSKSCGGGKKSRTRTCNNPSAANGGKGCSRLGAASQEASCNSHGCPVNGGYSSWSAYGACSKSCGGGKKSRTRTCNNPSAANGGKGCSSLGVASQEVSCNTNGCPVNGGWSSYESYGSCNKKCGTGTKTRHRSCSNPTPQNAGAQCQGSSSQSAYCNTEGCPDLINCAYKYTSYNTHSDGNMVYIDRHQPDCGSGKVVSMIHLQRSGSNMRYQYRCCQFKGRVYSMQSKVTSFSSDGGGKLYYLDRHTADCGTTGFISSLKVERNSGHDKVRYNYKCSNLNVQKWKNAASCYSTTTSFTDDGNGKVFYLDRQTVTCSSGYGLSYIKLERDSKHDNVRYRYRCCKVNY